MEEWNKDLLEPSADGIWTGRKVSYGPLYFYECVESVKNLSKVRKGDIVLTGYNCDEGVRRNQGRIGAAEGPSQIKKSLAKTAFTSKIYDLGNVICKNGEMEGAQETLRQITAAVLRKSAFPINIGGGHDISFATGSAVYNTFPAGESKVGIINFDAHFDLRKPSPQSHSGTPFYQLAQRCLSENMDFNYLVLGIQKQSNTEDLFKSAEELNVDYVKDENLRTENIGNAIKEFTSALDKLYVTIDLDVFSASFAPGVSAINPIGMDPHLLLQALKLLFETGKVCAIDIAEMNPNFDIDQRTAKLAAYLINEICRLFLSCSHES